MLPECSNCMTRRRGKEKGERRKEKGERQDQDKGLRTKDKRKRLEIWILKLETSLFSAM